MTRAAVAYGGAPLAGGGRCRWKVRVWDESGLVSDWSEPAAFEVELDRTSGWHATWIGPSRAREGVTPPSGAGPVDPVARALTPAEVRDAAGNPPASLASFRGAVDAQEAVFRVGSGAHEFSSPAIDDPGSSGTK